MRSEKIIKRPDGTRIKIISEVSLPFFGKIQWRQYVSIAKPRKRIFVDLENSDDYMWRRLSMEDRRRDTDNKILTVLTAEEVHEAHMELYEQMKPELLTYQPITPTI